MKRSRPCSARCALRATLLSSSLALAACGADTDAGDERIGTPMRSEEMAPAEAAAPAAPGASSGDGAEGAPNVTALDGSTAPGAAADARDDAAASQPSELPTPSDVPSTEHCAAVADWDPEWVAFEEEVLRLVNEARSQPADCGVEGQFESAAPLSMDPILRCSARLHSLDMSERDFFAHDNPDGVDPFERMAAAGFSGGGGGENIAAGQRSPESVMLDWMASDGHCANIMRAAFTTIGVGYEAGSGQRGGGSNFWTQNFGAPPFMRSGGRQR
jgi:uncharacterized protein YkwD